MKPDNDNVRTLCQTKTPLVLFGSFNERMYLAETNARAMFIQASFPGAIIRRHTGTPVMGYSGATWLVQEVCNALFDALFHMIPLASAMDKTDATPARLGAARSAALDWDDDARAALETLVEAQPVLVRISAAKRIRDGAERVAQRDGGTRVTTAHLESSRRAFTTADGGGLTHRFQLWPAGGSIVTSMTTTGLINIRASAPTHDWDSLHYRVIFALSFGIYFAAGMIRRLTPAFWRRAASHKSILAEAWEASGTTARIAFSG